MYEELTDENLLALACSDGDAFALERALREEDPPRPSDALARRADVWPVTPRELRGDIDRIVLLALPSIVPLAISFAVEPV